MKPMTFLLQEFDRFLETSFDGITLIICSVIIDHYNVCKFVYIRHHVPYHTISYYRR